MKKKETVTLLSQREISPGIFDLLLETDLAREAHAGQFVGVYPKGKDKLLPRPISICEVSDDLTALRLVYRVSGEGTKELSTLRAGDGIDILGILGNGYEFTKFVEHAETKSDTQILLELMDLNIVLLGGGIGIPPMLQTAKELHAHGCKPVIVAGYRNRDLFLAEDLKKYGKLLIATEDGSVGTKGTVLDAVKEDLLNPDIILACGPMPMLKAVARYSESLNKAGKKNEAFLSLEERMACGVGACLGCVTRTKEKDGHSHVKNARICTDGPVFRAGDLDI